MKTRTAFACIIMMCALALTANAGGKGELQKYFAKTAVKVKAADAPAEKRAILNNSFQTVTRALEMVQGSQLISENDRAGIDRVKSAIREKHDELAGMNGYSGVTDNQLDLFSNYVVQDMEQADQMVSISLVTLLLILIIVILLF